jgi:hypothetical protein
VGLLNLCRTWTDVADSADNRAAIIELVRNADLLFIEVALARADAALGTAGYRVVSQPYNVTDRVVRNLEITFEPPDSGPEMKTVVFGTHYDSVFDVPGANDNGSGVAAVVEPGCLLKDLNPCTRGCVSFCS